MADFDFTGLTEAHRRLLDRGGWTVAEASADNVPPITARRPRRRTRSIRGPPARSSTSCAPPSWPRRRSSRTPAAGGWRRRPRREGRARARVVLERLAAATGRPVGEDVVGQIVAVLDRVNRSQSGLLARFTVAILIFLLRMAAA